MPNTIDEIRSLEQLQELVVSGETNWKQYGEVNTVLQDDLILFNYTQAAQYNGTWRYFERISRGLILSTVTGEVVARPFDKFFNADGETPDSVLVSKLMEVTAKWDGSLGILYRYNGEYRIATRGSFTSEQAVWATNKLKEYDLTDLPDNLTLLFEIIYPANRVVVDYGDMEALVLIGARNRFDGYDLYHTEVKWIADKYGFCQPLVYTFDSLADILVAAAALDANSEGWVVRYSDGKRYKVKGDAYKVAHKLLTGISFKWVLEAVVAGAYEQAIEGVPDEFLATVKGYKAEIDETVFNLEQRIYDAWTEAPPTGGRKEYALWVMSTYRDLSAYLFAQYDNKDVKPLIYKHAFKEREAV